MLGSYYFKHLKTRTFGISYNNNTNNNYLTIREVRKSVKEG